LAPKLRSIGSYVATDILGVDLKKITERRAIKDILVAESKRLENEYAELDKKETSLAKKSHDLTEEIKAKQDDLAKAKEEEDKKKAEEEKKKAEEEEKKRGGFFDRLFKKEEKKKEEVKPEVVPEKKKEEVKPAPLPETKKPAPKVDVTKIPADDGSKKSGPAPEKPTTSEKKKEEKKSAGSGDSGMKYPSGSNVIKIISKYGMRQLPNETAPRLHPGIDYAADLGTPITFLGSKGKVTDASKHTGYGRTIDIAVDGEILRFAHLSSMLVKSKDVVKKGDTIGLVGGSGTDKNKALKEDAYGPHLHFEHRSTPSYVGEDTYDPVKSGAVSLVGFGNKLAATDYSLDEKYASYKGEYGKGLSAESSKVALAYREQSKPNNPTYVDARTRNNNVAQTNTNHIPAKA
jgi:murein DD-endopeptidase MepM/ murein hydrolase activator NlpD